MVSLSLPQPVSYGSNSSSGGSHCGAGRQSLVVVVVASWLACGASGYGVSGLDDPCCDAMHEDRYATSTVCPKWPHKSKDLTSET